MWAFFNYLLPNTNHGLEATLSTTGEVHYFIIEQLVIGWAISKNHQKVSGYHLSILFWRISYREVVNWGGFLASQVIFYSSMKHFNL